MKLANMTSMQKAVKSINADDMSVLSKYVYSLFMGYSCVLEHGCTKDKFTEPLLAVFMAGYHAGKGESANDE